MEFDRDGAEFGRRVKAGAVFIDRRSAMTGDHGHIADAVLAERQLIVRDGIVFVSATVDTSLNVVAGPQFVARGFTWPEGDQEIDRRAATYVLAALETLRREKAVVALHDLQQAMAKALGKFLYEQTRRRPIIESLIHELDHPEFIGEVPEEPYLYRETG